MNFSILSDFSDEDLEKMMDLGVKYSGEGSYAEPESISTPSWSNMHVVSRDMCAGAETYSAPNSHSTSWASALVLAAEAALRKEGYDTRFSLPYVLNCLKESQEVEFNEVSPSDIIEFAREKGLVTEESVKDIPENELCSADVPKFYFDVTKNDIPNKSGLMNFVAEGDPVIVLMALDLIRLKTVNDVTGDAIYTGATAEPSVYGVMKGFDETKWTVTFNVVPCENIEMNLPVVDNDTNANYGGIAGYAMSIKVASGPFDTLPTIAPTTEVPTTFVPTTQAPTENPREIVVDDSIGSIDNIPKDVTMLTFKEGSFNSVTSVVLDFPYLKTLIFENNTFINTQYVEINAPLLEELIVGENCFSGLATTRRLLDVSGRLVLNTPALKTVVIDTNSMQNINTVVLTQVSVDIQFDLSMGAMNNVNLIEYRVEISIEVVIQIKISIENNEGHEGPVDIELINPPTTQVPTTQAPTTQAPTTQAPTTQAPTTQAPTTQPPTTQAPTTPVPTTQPPTTQAPAILTPTIPRCPNGETYYIIERNYGSTPDASERMVFYYGYKYREFISISYSPNTTNWVTGCVKPQLMRIYLEGYFDGWNEDSYFVIQSEFGTSERISLNGKPFTYLFFHFSYGFLQETKVTNCQEFYDLDDSPQILHIDDYACNDESLTTFSVDRFPNLIFLWIESYNFKNVSTFDVRDNTKLEYVYIKDFSFTEVIYLNELYLELGSWKSFHLVNCERLISIEIGSYSFVDYAGEFELKNLPSLESIVIGNINADAVNFVSSSFVVRGISLSTKHD